MNATTRDLGKVPGPSNRQYQHTTHEELTRED
jgi:hypothetical protein